VSFERLEKLLFKVDGKAACRIRNVIMEKIESHKPSNNQNAIRR